jgi:hypothetical protein
MLASSSTKRIFSALRFLFFLVVSIDFSTLFPPGRDVLLRSYGYVHHFIGTTAAANQLRTILR